MTFAAASTVFAVLENIISCTMELTGWKRLKASIVSGVGIFILSIPCILGFNVWSHITPLGQDLLTFFDFVSNSVIMPIVAFLTCIFVGYVIKVKAVTEEVELSGKFKAKNLFTVMIKYIAPVFLLIILVFYTLAQFGFISY